MSGIPDFKNLVFKDTSFANLMNKRIYNVLLIATKYDAFMLEDDGRVDEQIFNEYTSLSLRYPPRFTQVTTEEEALAELKDRNFELRRRRRSRSITPIYRSWSSPHSPRRYPSGLPMKI